MFKMIKSKAPELCIAYRCGNKPKTNDRFCSKHRHRYTKETNTVAYVYNIFRSNARRRNKDFTITLEEFKDFCEETNYIELRGKKAGSGSIDRIDHTKGYSRNNIQILTLSCNSAKRFEDEQDDCPF